MKFNLLKHITYIALIFSFTLSASAAGLSSPSHRSERMEISFQTRHLDSVKLSTDKGAEIDINSTLGWAFGVGYNYSENWAFNFDIAWSDSNYSANFTDSNGDSKFYSNRVYSSTTNFGAIYHFSAKRFTPFVGASIGWAFIDSNIRDGLNEIYCSPFFPYYCYAYTPTKNTTEFTYGAQAGLRFDVNKQLFFKASVGNQWVDYGNVKGTPDLTIYRIDIGFMF